MKRVLILGAAGRDFHNFNVVFRHDPEFQVVAFTAAQIPDIIGRRYPAELAGALYPDGIPILDESKMEAIIGQKQVDVVVFSYSDVAHATVMHLASRAVACNADFWLLGVERTQLVAKVPVISVCAVRTGCGKSPVSRRIATELRTMGWNPVVVRHPMPYGDLVAQRAQRFGSLADLDRYDCTIEEREEYEPHIIKGITVYAGVDYEEILHQAENDGDVILWDGGNNDTAFYRPDLDIVVLDPHRPGHELAYFPGEVNFRTARVLIINKVETADPDGVHTVRRNIALHNATAQVIETACKVTVTDPEQIRGKNVLVVEDGPTLTHGEMPYGAGVVAANRYNAASLVDPRPYAVGSIQQVFEKFPHLWRVLPAMGYSDTQRHELEETIKRVPCDLVLVATPINLAHAIKLDKPSVRVTYEIEEIGSHDITRMLEQFTETRKAAFAGAGI
jgi:predicted GTPase